MSNHSKLFQILLILIPAICLAQPKTYFVAVNGSDSNSGTIDLPFATLTKASSSVAAGDTIYIRGGKYSLSSTISLSKSGSAGNTINVFAYKKEKPVFDFTTQASSDGIKINGNYWHLKGLESSYAAHNGIAINASYNIVENCSVHDNRNSGMQLGNGASYNRILNCDSYYNFDPPLGGNADGYSPKLDVGTGNYFYGCRSWQNSDDGYDGYLRPSDNVTTTLENCWAFMNGYLKDGSQIATGNGNGFKMGGSDAKNLHHNFILRNCLAFDNRVKGFDQNNNLGSMTLYNCTGFRNGSYNFSIPSSLSAGYTAVIKNSVSLLSPGVSLIPATVAAADSWLDGFTVSSADFLSVDTTGARGPRKADGSLPDITFMHLAVTSKLIDAGVDVGIPYAGKAPDLGAFEYGMSMLPAGVKKNDGMPLSLALEQNYPNPFNPVTTISYSIPAASQQTVTLKVYDLLGREIATLINEEKPAGNYEVKFDGGRYSSGVYFYKLTAGAFSVVKKMIILK